MYEFLYIFGSERHKVYKIGVTFNNITYRFLMVKEKFKYYYDSEFFSEILILKNKNAFRLELYLKQKFKDSRHPDFYSDEWFISDLRFLEIYNFRI